MSVFRCLFYHWLTFIVVAIVFFAQLAINQSPSSGGSKGHRIVSDVHQDASKTKRANTFALARSRRWAILSPFADTSVPMAVCPNAQASKRHRGTRAKLALFRADLGLDILMTQGADGHWPERDIKRLLKSGFDLKIPTIIYSHGFMQTYRNTWLLAVRQNFRKLYAAGDRHNVMFYDWGNYGLASYQTAAGYAPYIGRLAAEFLEYLRDKHNYSMDNVHLFGYSLSTQIFGQTGRKLGKNQLGQLTLIDPTGVCFHSQTEFAKTFTVGPDDAKLVVAKEYDWGALGPHKAIGGVDILVNGGTNQPPMRFGSSSIRGFINHVRAIDHEVSHFDDNCHEVAYACPSYAKFLMGECGDCGKDGSRCYMINTYGAIKLKLKQTPDKQGNVMYITTGKSNYCIHHYQIVAVLKPNSTPDIGKAFESGALTVSFNNGVGRLSPSHRVNEHQYTALMRAEQKLISFQRELNVVVQGSDTQLSDLLSSLKYIDVKYMSNIFPEERTKASARYCPEGMSKLVKCSQ